VSSKPTSPIPSGQVELNALRASSSKPKWSMSPA
jgi:hypothetical protein